VNLLTETDVTRQPEISHLSTIKPAANHPVSEKTGKNKGKVAKTRSSKVPNEQSEITCVLVAKSESDKNQETDIFRLPD